MRPAHFHVIALADDHDVVARRARAQHGAVRDVDERAGGFDHVEPQGAGPRERAPGRAVGRHHQRRRPDVGEVLRDGDALRLEGGQHGGVVDEVAEDRERAGVGVVEGEGDGVADAEAHAEVGRSEDTHGSQFTQRTL